MYRHSGSLDSVRAPQMRMPRPGNARMQLMPTLFRPPCSACVTWKPRPLAPRTTSFAGALWTPRVVVGPAPDAGHVTRRRNQHRLVRERVHDLDPRVVERRELRVVARGVHPPLEDLLRQQVRRRVEDRHPVAGALAVGDHLALEVAQLRVVVVQAHDVRHHDHRDLVDRGQAAHALAARDVALEVAGLDLLGRDAGSGQRVGAGRGSALRLGQRGAGLLDLDQLRRRVDLGREVVAALLERQALELLLARRAGVDDELVGRRRRPRRPARLLGDLDLHAAVDALERLGAERLDAPCRPPPAARPPGGRRRSRARRRARPSTASRRSGRTRRPSARGTRPP